MGSIPTGTKLLNNLGQVVHTYVPPSPSSITWYWSKDGDVLWLWKWPQTWRKVMATYHRRDDLKSHLWADCLYTGISSGTNAQFSCASILGIYAAVHYVLSSFTAMWVCEYKWIFSSLLWNFFDCHYWASILYVLSSLTATCCLLDTCWV